MKCTYLRFLFIAALVALGVGPSHAQQSNSVFGGSIGKTMQLKTFAPSVRMASDVSLPPSVDNSKLKYFPPIIDQNGGSCAQAAGIGYMFTYEVNRLLDRDASASKANRFSYQFSWNFVNDGIDQGGFVDDGLTVARLYGMMTEEDYGTSGLYEFKWASGYDKYFNAMHYRVQEMYVFADSIPLMKRYLYDAGDRSKDGGILTFSAKSTWKINDDYEGPSLTGYKSLLTALGTSGSHAVTIAGYDDTVEYTDGNGVVHMGAFIVVNSWGRYSHDEGRFYLPYDFFRDPDVDNLTLGSTVTAVKVCTYEPKVVMKVKIDYTSRDDLYFGVGGNADASAKSAKQFYYDSGAFHQQGGDIPMGGNQGGSTIEFALDATRCLPSGGKEYKKMFLNVVRSFKGKSKGEGSLVALSIIDYRGVKPVEYECSEALPAALKDGDNVFAVSLVRRDRIPSSPYKYKDEDGVVSSKAYLLRSAGGKAAKIKFGKSADGKVNITYHVEK